APLRGRSRGAGRSAKLEELQDALLIAGGSDRDLPQVAAALARFPREEVSSPGPLVLDLLILGDAEALLRALVRLELWHGITTPGHVDRVSPRWPNEHRPGKATGFDRSLAALLGIKRGGIVAARLAR